MNKIILLTVVFCLFISGQAEAKGDVEIFVPQVIYIEPKGDSIVNLTGKAVLRFSWQPLPIPSGERDSYRIVIIKEPNAGYVFDKKIDDRTFSIDVPANVFEDASRYSWHVRQRDARTMDWSNYYIWYFNIIKK